MRQTILLALVLTCTSARADQWVPVPALTEGAGRTFVDVSSLRVDGAVRRAWFKFIFAPQATRGGGGDANKWQSFLVVRDAFLCDAKSSRIEAEDVHFDDGSVSAASADYFPTRWRRVAPNSVIGRKLAYVCALPRPKS
jgi:hypothetical protein